MKRSLQTYYLRTYGCQMNELDSEIMMGELERRGLTRTSDEKTADLLIFNTCSIRDLAERKVMGKLGQIGQGKQKNAVIGVTGCMANAKKSNLFRKLPHVDFVLGTNNLHELGDVLDEVMLTGQKCAKTDAQFTTELDYTSAQRDDKIKAYVSIIRGCNKFCTYCVVPYTRGQEVSRTPESIEDECRKLVDKGYREITLLGQNVNSYGKDKPEIQCLFPDLLHKLDGINGLDRIRFMTSHPYDITESLMEAVRDLPSICEFVHFPIQAGSDRILRKMHRMYSVQEYLEKIQRFREIAPGVQLGTDIIVGFPTETDEEFELTYRVLKDIEYSVAFIFAYSPRKGTPAIRWKDDIPEVVKEERLQRLMQLQNEIYSKQRQDLVGKTVEVLVERASTRDPGRVKGRTRCWKNAVLPGSEALVGTVQKMEVSGYSHQTLIGTPNLGAD